MTLLESVAIPLETQFAMDFGLEEETRRSDLQSLTFWGSIQTENGKDYLILRSDVYELNSDDLYERSYRFLASQDGTHWFALPSIDNETSSNALSIGTLFSGDVSKIDTLFAKDDDEGKLIEVIELDRLRAIVDVITKATDVTPSGAELSLPDGQHVTNPHFSSIRYPNQLSSYLHRYNGSHLTEDLKGVWNLHYDTFENATILRHLYWIGYHFVYDHKEGKYRGVYVGDGRPNSGMRLML